MMHNNSKIFLKIFGIITGFLFYTSLAFAGSIPPYIHYQGRLVDQSTGVPINGKKSITFSLYNIPSGGNPIYSQTKQVTIDNGTFSVYLGIGEGYYDGNTIADGISEDVFTEYSARYLGIKIEDSAEEMTPRQLIVSAAYAYKAEVANTVKGEIMVTDSGNVGIGKLNPSEKLDVEGNVKVSGDGYFPSGKVTAGDFLGDGIVPIGTIIAWPTETPPNGYLECNGSAVFRTQHQELFNVIGTMYGDGDGSTTFNIPDYRGYFLRGYDHMAGNDPDSGLRTDRGDGTSGDAVGTKQTGQIKEHRHTIRVDWSGANTHNGTDAVIAEETIYRKPGTAARSLHPESLSDEGGNETRPLNISVMYCIKY